MIRKQIDFKFLLDNPPDIPVYVIYAPTVPLNEINCIEDFISVEIPMKALLPYLNPSEEHGPNHESYYALYTLIESCAGYTARWDAYSIVDQIVDLNEMPIPSLEAILNEYDNEWFADSTLVPSQLEDEVEKIQIVRNRIAETIEQKQALEAIAHRFVCLKPGRAGFVYLLKSNTGHWKIGRATDPNNRLKTFGIQLPFEVEFEHLIPTDNMAEAEQMLHDHFASKRLRGEWFDLSPEDVAYIKAIQRI